MDSPWWEPIEVAVGSAWSRAVGLGSLTVEHDAFEWRVAATRNGGAPPAALRIATESQSNRLVLRPRLADRPVIARLEIPLHLASHDSATIYVGSPLWAEVELDPPNGRAVGELRLFDPPNTWFGPSTRRGELCYASRTAGRLRRELVEHQGDRAVTTVVVENTSATALVFARLRIPIPHLSLYVGGDGSLWTNRVFIHHAGSDPPPDTIEEGAPTALDVGDLTELAGPRETVQSNLLSRAFGALM